MATATTTDYLIETFPFADHHVGAEHFFAVSFTGTQLVWKTTDFTAFGVGGTIRVYIDVAAGGSTANLTADASPVVTGATTGDVTLITGLTDAAHTAHIHIPMNSRFGGGLEVTGSTPAIAPLYPDQTAPGTSKLAYFSDYGSGTGSHTTITNGVFRFFVNITSATNRIAAYHYRLAGRILGQTVDGATSITTFTSGTTGTRDFECTSIVANLSVGVHEIRIWGIEGGVQFSPNILISGGAMVTTAMADTPRKVGLYTDSKASNVDGSGAPRSLDVLCALLNAIPFTYGVGGSCAKDFPAGSGGCPFGGQLQSRVDGVDTTLDDLVVEMMTNDIAPACGAETQAEFDAADLDMMQKLRLRLPSARLWRSSGLSRLTQETQIRAYTLDAFANAATLTPPGITMDVNPAGSGLLLVGGDTTDGIHMNTSGHLKVGQAWGGQMGFPATPTGFGGDTGASMTQMHWDAPAVNPTSYTLQRRLSGIGSFVTIASPAGSATTYDDTTTVNGVAYDYRLSATNAAGTSAYTSTVTKTAEGPLQPGGGGGRGRLSIGLGIGIGM